MKANAKVVMWAFVAVPFVVVFVLALVGGQKTQAKYELGPVAWSEMGKINGGATEGPGCYQQNNPNCGGTGGKSNRTCSGTASTAAGCGDRIIYYAVQQKRNKGLFESRNTKVENTSQYEICNRYYPCFAYQESNGTYTCSNPSTSLVFYWMYDLKEHRCPDP